MPRGTVFPDIAPTEFTCQPEVVQIRDESQYGDLQITVPHPFTRYHITWGSEMLNASELSTLRQHFLSNAATYFSLYGWLGWKGIDPLIVAPVVAGQLTYTLPAKEVSGLTLYDNATSSLISPSRYTRSAGTGAESADQIIFNSSGTLPVAGHTLIMSAVTGRRKYTVWYETTQFPEELDEVDIFKLAEPLRFRSQVAP